MEIETVIKSLTEFCITFRNNGIVIALNNNRLTDHLDYLFFFYVAWQTEIILIGHSWETLIKHPLGRENL